MRTTPKTQDRLADALADRLCLLLDGPNRNDIRQSLNLYPARGYWRQAKADVMSVTGDFKHNGLTYTLGCWESMTDCLRFGFDLEDCRGQANYADFMFGANERRSDRSDRWYSSVQLDEIERQKANATPSASEVSA